jgi:hypothetical protein
MQIQKPVGRGAAARKYDILTSLGTFALSLGKSDQRRALRLITLITARYNWAGDELSVGQREIARMWSCDERTVKREMAWFRGQGWLVVHVQGARGRVTRYGLGIEKILEDTKTVWGHVGPDFQTRMAVHAGEDTPNNVVPLQPTKPVNAPDVSDGSEWALAQAILHQENPARYGAWFAALKRHERVGGRLVLVAPTRFHAGYVLTHLMDPLLAACRSVDDGISDVVIQE